MQIKIRKKIFQLVGQLHKLEKSKKEFIPGKTFIPYAGRVFDSQELVNLVDSSLEFWLTEGRYTVEFEEKLAQFLKTKYCLFVNSGSSANLLAVTALTSSLLKGRRLKPGDEVITTACGFPTTLNAIIQNNLLPVFVDIELGTYNIKTEYIEKAITAKTKAIFVAHTLGNPVNLSLIKKICRKYRLFFLEDNCDALGSQYQGKYTGSFGDISTCSFYPAHHITTGEGGAVLTNEPLLKRIILSLRDWGRDCWCKTGHDNTCGRRFLQKFGTLPFGYDHKYVYSHMGYNLKATDMQAAIGCAQIRKLNDFIKARRKNFAYLYNFLKRYEQFLLLPHWQEKSEPSWFGFPILIKEGQPFNRNDIVTYLEKHKIATRMLFGGNLLRQPAYRNIKYRACEPLRNTDLAMNNLFWIGVYPGLDESMLRYIKDIFTSFFKEKL